MITLSFQLLIRFTIHTNVPAIRCAVRIWSPPGDRSGLLFSWSTFQTMPNHESPYSPTTCFPFKSRPGKGLEYQHLGLGLQERVERGHVTPNRGAPLKPPARPQLYQGPSESQCSVENQKQQTKMTPLKAECQGWCCWNCQLVEKGVWPVPTLQWDTITPNVRSTRCI